MILNHSILIWHEERNARARFRTRIQVFHGRSCESVVT